MIGFFCDWCGSGKNGYRVNELNPLPEDWWSRRHYARIEGHGGLHESQLHACSVDCVAKLDAHLNVPPGIRMWASTSSVVDGLKTKKVAIPCDTDDARPVRALDAERAKAYGTSVCDLVAKPARR